MDAIFLDSLIFASVVLFYYGIRLAFLNGGKRSPVSTGNRNLPLFFATFSGEIDTLGGMMGTGESPSDLALEKSITLAALPLTVRMVRGAQLLAACILGAVLALLVLLTAPNPFFAALAVLGGGAMGWILPGMWVRRCGEERKSVLSKELPFALDMVTVSMQAGLEFGAAIRQLVKESGQSVLANEFAVMLKEVELGKTRIEAMRTMAGRIQLEEFISVVSAVEQGTDLGASITKTLQIQAEELRRLRYHRAERKAARAPSLMIMPMALFILPSVFIIIFVPILVRLAETGVLKNMGGG